MTDYTVTDAPPAPPPPGRTTNWKVIIPVAIVLVLCCICLVVVGVLAYMGTQGTGPLSMLATATSTPTLTPTPELSLVGDWAIYFDWDCTGSSSTGAITFYNDNTYWVNDDDTLWGTWFTSGEYVDFTFNEYPNSHYIGTLDYTGNYMEGTMDNLDSMTGCWYAER